MKNGATMPLMFPLPPLLRSGCRHEGCHVRRTHVYPRACYRGEDVRLCEQRDVTGVRDDDVVGEVLHARRRRDAVEGQEHQQVKADKVQLRWGGEGGVGES